MAKKTERFNMFIDPAFAEGIATCQGVYEDNGVDGVSKAAVVRRAVSLLQNRLAGLSELDDSERLAILSAL